MKKKVSALAAVTIATMLTASLAGCGSSNTGNNGNVNGNTKSDTASNDKSNAANSNNTTTETEEKAPLEPVKISALIGPSSLSGVQSDEISTEIFEKKFGLKIDHIFAGDKFDERLSAIMASGDMPDLIEFKDKKQFESAVKAGVLMSLDDLVAQYGPDITNNLPSMLQYMRDNYSDGSGKLYGLASQIGVSQPTNLLHMALYSRYDLYKKAGSPELKTFDDLLNTLKTMQAEYPKNDKGQKVYPLQLWSDWDSISMSLVDFTIPGYMGVSANSGTLQFTEYDPTTKQLKSVFDPSSDYMKGVEFFHKANQQGILDPDSISQKWPNAESKTKEGRVLTTMWGWQSQIFNGNDLVKSNPMAGMIPLFPKDEAKMLVQAELPVGGGYVFGIGKNSKNADRIIQLLNYSATVQGSTELMNGVEGKAWTLNNGKAEYAPEYLEKVAKNDPSTAGYESFLMLNKWNIDPRTNESITHEGWSQFVKKNLTSAEQEWATANNSLNVYDYAKKNLTVVQDDGVVALAGAPSDDIKVIQQKLGEILKTMSWKMVYAKNDAQFNELKQELIDKATQLGADKNFQWAQTELAAASAKASKYTEYHVQ
ncbi:extracellular solute-binding protein [Paenibacillus lignilyticus]|uniref:Extracellular solute-binding protein n=1 Tax=Paenibacillus lignilyticus TaxID=1172615 RepID=A0ABS5C9A7_9BACL|nr:extracellular solute-binding protein [Paenibacillus lignilyticus]MBP3962572.1 extracellular solute-binding protein [Paenibacillus lignilyticus]